LKSALTKKGVIPTSIYIKNRFSVITTNKQLKTILFRYKQALCPLSPQIQNRYRLTGKRKKRGLGRKRKGGVFSKPGLL